MDKYCIMRGKRRGNEENMEEETKSGYESQEEKAGTVKIADDVVAMIAALAATEVDGVAAMAGNLTNELLSRVGVRGLSRGSKVEVSV